MLAEKCIVIACQCLLFEQALFWQYELSLTLHQYNDCTKVQSSDLTVEKQQLTACLHFPKLAGGKVETVCAR